MESNFKEKIENHKDLKGKIKDSTYEKLANLYEEIISFTSAEEMMEKSIEYRKKILIIRSLLEEYKDGDDEKRKEIIDYYINNNKLKELNSIGLCWYYDMKFKRSKATLYSSNYEGASNWEEKFKEKEFEKKEKLVQFIFKTCNMHINKGNKHVKLKSLSTSFFTVLYKYMEIDKDNNANLYIIKNAEINFIETHKRESLQQYIVSENRVENTKFCIAFGDARDKNLDNYNKWGRNYNKEHIEIVERNNGDEENKTGLGSRISPIKDEEVIVSHEFWDIEKYESSSEIEPESKKCYHFTFNLPEYGHLLYCFFRLYNDDSEINNNEIKIDDDAKKEMKDYIKKIIELIKKQIEELEELEEVEKIKDRKEIFKSIQEELENKIDDVSYEKIETVLSLIDWKIEKKEKKKMKIRKRDNQNTLNLIANLFKEGLKNV